MFRGDLVRDGFFVYDFTQDLTHLAALCAHLNVIRTVNTGLVSRPSKLSIVSASIVVSVLLRISSVQCSQEFVDGQVMDWVGMKYMCVA